MTARPALFASAYAPHVGGVEELVRQLAAEQRRRGLDPSVVTMRWPQELPAAETVEGTDVLRHVFHVPGPTWRHTASWAVRGGRTRRDVVGQLRDRRSDLVHVQCVSSNARYATTAADALGLPLVVTMQGELTMDAAGLYQRSAQMRRTWRRALDRADVITGCSQYVVDEAQEHLGRSLGERAVAVPNGIRLADFDGPAPDEPDRPFVLGIGRMVPQKGFDLLLDAFLELAPAHPDVDLVLAGDGPVRAQLEARAGGAPRVRFVGSVGRTRAVELFRAATAFVLGSRHEPQGIVVLEAMAARTPVVAARVGGVPEMVTHGENGLLFESGRSDDLAAQLDRVLRDDALRRRLVAAGRARAEHHDWARITDAYLALYATAAERHRGGG